MRARYKKNTVRSTSFSNIGFPDFVMDDQLLTLYYQGLNLTATDTVVQIEQKLFEFEMAKMINSLSLLATVRDDFNGPPGLVNAWYQVLQICFHCVHCIAFHGCVLCFP